MGTALASRPVKASTGRILVKVTQDDIDRGYRNKSDCCPIALALIRMGFKALTVYCHRASFLDAQTGEFLFRDLPDKAKKFVKAFDSQQDVKPFSFHL